MSEPIRITAVADVAPLRRLIDAAEAYLRAPQIAQRENALREAIAAAREELEKL